MENTIIGNYFKTNDDRHRISSKDFAIIEIKEIMKRRELQVHRMIPAEKYVDFYGKSLELLRYVALRNKSWREVYSESQNSRREERSKVCRW